MNKYYFFVEIPIENGLLTPEQIKQAAKKLPEGYIPENKLYSLSMTESKASVIFEAFKPTASTFPTDAIKIVEQKNPLGNG